MDKKQLQEKLLATFKLEAAEHVQALSANLFELGRADAAGQRAQLVETLFRAAHSLKGAARAVDLAEIESICQSLESVLGALKRGQMEAATPLLDLLHDTVAALGQATAAVAQGAPGSGTPRSGPLLQRLQAAAKGGETPNAPPAAEAAQPAADAPAPASPEARSPLAGTVRVTTARLDALLFRAEELVAAKLAGAQRAAELRSVANEPGLRLLAASAEQDQRALAAMVDGLLDDMKKVLMQPAASALEVLPRMVRELSRDQGKLAELRLNGGEIEIDRRILEEMRDPLIHLVRNCIDHGIEPPTLRERAGKPAAGRVTIAIAQASGDKIEIAVSDDGAGIDLDRVRKAARRLDPAAGENLLQQDGLPLIFESGVSTAPIITDLSGRGLGLAIVREKVEKLGGVVTAETQPGHGTLVRMVLPLTLARFRGVQVRVGEQPFVLPITHVEQALRLRPEAIRSVENRETIPWQGQAASLVRLADVLELARPAAAAGDQEVVQVVVLRAGGQCIAFQVDEIQGEQEVLVKPLGEQVAHMRHIAGATVLGSGKTVPILNVADLMRSAAGWGSAIRTPVAPAQPTAQRKSVLIAEDSITSRALLQHILESAGYRVATAVDGIDAYTQLKTAPFDLVVSDVEMPRMDGFELTRKIRADPALASLPVVLVTALESREHREAGVEAGADAYIVKSGFDQDNLLEIMGRLF